MPQIQKLNPCPSNATTKVKRRSRFGGEGNGQLWISWSTRITAKSFYLRISVHACYTFRNDKIFSYAGANRIEQGIRGAPIPVVFAITSTKIKV